MGDGVKATDALPTDRLFPTVTDVHHSVSYEDCGDSDQQEIIADVSKLPSESKLSASAVYDREPTSSGTEPAQYTYNPNAF